MTGKKIPGPFEAAVARARAKPTTVAPLVSGSAIADHVNNYFYTKLNVRTGDKSFDALAVDSACGRDCCRAIDAAAAFIHHMKAAGTLDTSVVTIHEACLEVIQIYWHG